MPIKKRKRIGNRPAKVAIEHTGFYPYLQRFLEHRRVNHFSEETLKRQDSMIRIFIAWCDDRALDDPREITRPILERYKKHLFYKRKSNGDPLSIRAQGLSLSSLKTFFSWLTKENYLLYNPASDLDIPKRPQQLPRNLLSVDDVKDLLNAPDSTTANGLRDRVVMEILYSCGLRRKEAAGLQLQDINLKRGTLLVRQGKGNKDRMLPLGESAWRWLEKYTMDARPELIGVVDDGAVFISDYGDAYDGAAIGRMVKRYMKKVKLDMEGGAHLFRHAMATHMLENGADIRYIQVMLGHSDLRSTQIYTQVSVETLRAVHAATHPAKMKQSDSSDGHRIH